MKRKWSVALWLACGIGALTWVASTPKPGLAQGAQSAGSAASSGQQQQPPYSEKEALNLIKHNKKHLAKVTPELTQRGVDFDVTPEIEADLRKAGADDALVEVIKQLGPTARAARAAQGQSASGPVITAAEQNAYGEVRNELDPDKDIQAAEDFAKNYPHSLYLSYVYFFEGNAYRQKGKLTDSVAALEKSVKAKPDNLAALSLLSQLLPQPQLMQGSDAEKQRSLDEAEKDAEAALKLLDQVPKQPNETDDAYQKRKADYESPIHSALGLVYLQRADMSLAGPDKAQLAKAEQEYKTALSMSSQPDPADYFRLAEVYRSEGNNAAAIDSFTKAGDAAGPGSSLKAMADQEIATLKKAEQSPKP